MASSTREAMTPTQQQDYYDNSPKARWLAVVSICLSIFIVVLTLSATNIAIPAIAADMQADAVAVGLIPVALIWGTIVLLLPVGRIADSKGRKKVYIVGVLCFSLVSLLFIFVSSIEMFLLLRVLQGFCAAMINGTGIAIIGAVFANANRGAALGFSSASVYLALSCGPVIGGWITEYTNWRGIFWLPIPLMLVSLFLVLTYLKGEWKKEKPEPLDWLGSALFALWISVLFFGISAMPNLWAIGLIGIGLGLLAVFLRQQHQAQFPLLRLNNLSSNRILNRSLLSSLMMYSANFAMVFLLSLYLQFIHKLSPTDAGEMVLIQTVIMMLLSPISGRLSDRYEPRIIATIGCFIFSFGYFILYLASVKASIDMVWTALVILGLGFGLFSSPNNNATLGSVTKDVLSMASVLLTLARNLGNMLGTVVVLTLMSFAIGDSVIQPENYEQLLWVVQTTFVLSLVVTFVAGFVSLSRGKLH